jgi:hypothetical protein
MKTIQTKPDCTLGFYKIVEGKNKYFPNSTAIRAIGDSNLTEKSIYIGNLSEITEEQARELVGGMECIYETYGKLSPWAEYGTEDQKGGGKKYFAIHAVDSLQSAALSVGIEEKDFDKYLVIKL